MKPLLTLIAAMDENRLLANEHGIPWHLPRDVAHFRDARHFASWFGLTPKEYSSGATRHLGRISKRGDRYLRMLLTHGARAVLRAATVAVRAGKSVDGLRQWALTVQARSNHNQATCAR